MISNTRLWPWQWRDRIATDPPPKYEGEDFICIACGHLDDSRREAHFSTCTSLDDATAKERT